eukprot:2680982-Pleurochrysis_carterae.AAC.1
MHRPCRGHAGVGGLVKRNATNDVAGTTAEEVTTDKASERERADYAQPRKSCGAFGATREALSAGTRV